MGPVSCRGCGPSLRRRADGREAAVRAGLPVTKLEDILQRPDEVCEHGTALDVHCCNCHSGFLFDPNHMCPPTKWYARLTRLTLIVACVWFFSAGARLYTHKFIFMAGDLTLGTYMLVRGIDRLREEWVARG